MENLISTQVCLSDSDKNRNFYLDDVYKILILNNEIKVFCLDGFTAIFPCADNIQINNIFVWKE